jgi:hypothetical protein
MSEQEKDIEQLKASVSCAVLLERLPPVWQLDRAESSRACLKYRRGEGEILIVNHGGRGWWDPLSEAKGDIFNLAQHLEPGLSFPEARRMLCDFVGIAPAYPEVLRTRRTRTAPALAATDRWEAHWFGSISPGNADCRTLSSWRRARPTPSGKVREAAPGSRTGMTGDVSPGSRCAAPTFENSPLAAARRCSVCRVALAPCPESPYVNLRSTP